jgi:transposase, IS5 family
MYQTEIVNLEDLVPSNHAYRKFAKIWSFKDVEKRLSHLVKDNNNQGFGILRLFKCLLLQFMEDISDRELERFMQDNLSAKWFCGFGLSEETPDYSVFSKLRKKIGTSLLSEIFADLRSQLKSQGLMSETFTFVDATHLIAKANLWEERDKAIQEKYEKLNNETLPKVAYDKQAKIGCKGKDKFWYGYKQHTALDMQSGLINKIAITPANVADANGLAHVAPNSGAIYADKGYCSKPCQIIAKKKGLHLAAVKNNNMKDKNKDKDKWYSKLRAPYERVFAKRNKLVRYVGIAKNQFSGFMYAICFNLKRLVALNIPDLQLS